MNEFTDLETEDKYNDRADRDDCDMMRLNLTFHKLRSPVVLSLIATMSGILMTNRIEDASTAVRHAPSD